MNNIENTEGKRRRLTQYAITRAGPKIHFPIVNNTAVSSPPARATSNAQCVG